LFQAFAHRCAARLNPNVGWLLLQTSTGWSGSIAHRRRFEVRPFGYSFQNCQQLSGNGRFHLALHFSTNSANGGLQSTSVTGPEKRQRRAWVVLRSRWEKRGRGGTTMS
jgi:hypothetical protein